MIKNGRWDLARYRGTSRVNILRPADSCMRQWLGHISSCNGLLPVQRQAIAWTKDDSMSIWPPGTNYSEIIIIMWTFFQGNAFEYVVCKTLTIFVWASKYSVLSDMTPEHPAALLQLLEGIHPPARLILGLRPADERRCYFVTLFPIGWAQA